MEGNSKTILNTEAILDTGTNLILGPSSEVTPIIDKIKSRFKNCKLSNELYQCPCNFEDLSKYPIITFYFGGIPFSISPENYLYYYKENCVLLFSESYDSY